MSSRTFGPGSEPLTGEVHVPGDKSLSHRAVLFSAMAEGTTELRGVLDSDDVRSTIVFSDASTLCGVRRVGIGTLPSPLRNAA